MEISGIKLSQIAGLKDPTRIRWTKEGLLADRPPFGELDVIEASALHGLVKELGMDESRHAWRDVRPQLRQIGDRLDVVYDFQRVRATVATTLEELRDAVVVGGLVQVVVLGGAIHDAREAARRVADSRRAAPAKRQPGRSRTARP